MYPGMVLLFGKSVGFFLLRQCFQGMYREERRSLSSNGFELEMSPRCLAS